MTTLYAPQDVVYVLALESWRLGDKRATRVVGRYWFTPESLVDAHEYLREFNLNQRANIYVGVNPRTHPNSPRVEKVRCVWADVDHEAPDVTLARLPPVLPKPSMVLASGTGTHLYWKLSEPIDVSGPVARGRFEAMLQRFYADIGGDCVQNVDRLLRLPGFQNQKDARNRRPPIPCRLVSRNESTYPLSAFDRWSPDHEPTRAQKAEQFHALNCPRSERTQLRVAGLLRHLDIDVADRSKRDFSCVCGLIRLGITDPEEIATLVAGHSKFADNPKYLARTIQKALDAVMRQ